MTDFAADDDTFHITAALWSGYIRAIERTRGPKLLISTIDVETMLKLHRVAGLAAAQEKTDALRAHVAKIADRAPPACPDLDQEYHPWDKGYNGPDLDQEYPHREDYDTCDGGPLDECRR